MAYTQAQLTGFFTNAQTGVAPNAAQSLTLQAIATQNATGQLTDAQALAQTTNLAANGTTDVSVGTYQFFTGTAPSSAGLAFLNAAYTGTGAQAGLNGENRFIAESVALATQNTAAKAAFTTSYGSLTIAQATAAAYNIIIGNPAAAAAGVDVNAAVAFLSSKASTDYYTAFIKANTTLTSAADIDLAVKAAIVGEILYIADSYNNGAGLGAYATATNALVADLADDGVLTANNTAGIDLFTAYPSSAPGAVLALTLGSDVIPGTAGNDVYNATIGGGATTDTISGADSINGAGGRDTLNITTTATTADATGGADIRNVEVLNIRATTGTATVAGGGFSEIWSDRGTGAVTVTAMTSGETIGIRGNGAVTNGAVSATYAAGATAASVALADGVKAGALTLVGADLTSVTITSTGAANALGATALGGSTTVKTLTVDAQSDITTGALTGFAAASTINVKGAGKANIGTLEAATITTLDASANTGGVTAVLNAAPTLKVTGGTGNDTFTTGGTNLTTGSVNAGAGTDRLVVTAAAEVATATLWGKFTGFEQIQTNGQNLDFTVQTGLTSVFAQGTVTLDNVTTQAVTINGNASPTINVTGATIVGQLDTLNVTVSDEAAAVNTITLTAPAFAGVETINFNAVDNLTVTALTGTGALTNMTLTGAGAIDITTGALALNANTKVDASAATGAVTFNASAATTNGLELIGTTSSKVNTLTGSAQADKITGGAGADILVGGAGNDIVIGNAGADKITGGTGADTLTGGDGNDTFIFATRAEASSGFAAADTTTAHIDKIVDFTGNGSAAGDGIQLGLGAAAFGTAITFTGATVANVTAVTVATAADFTALTAAVQAASAGVASSAVTAQVYDVTVTAGNLAGHYLIVNDATNAIDATDTIISITGSGALHASDFTFA